MCRKKRATELAIRCVLHSSLYKQNCFLTLTYDESKKGYHNEFQYEDIQKFKKRLRRYCEYKFKKKIQVFNVHEYGKNTKKHWHLVVFNHDFHDKQTHKISKGNRLYISKRLTELWPHGFSTIGDVTEASAMYQAQYTQKDLKNGNTQNKYKSHSKHSGIGRDYFLLHYKQILQNGFVPLGGKKIPIPRYFQKLAHKHYSHFYEPQNFQDYPERKKLYSPFRFGINTPTYQRANREIAELYKTFSTEKQTKIEQLTLEWEQTLQEHLDSNEKPDFIKSAENYLYNLHNKQNLKEF